MQHSLYSSENDIENNLDYNLERPLRNIQRFLLDLRETRPFQAQQAAAHHLSHYWLLGNPDLDFENLNPDFPIERTHNVVGEPLTESGKFLSVSFRALWSQGFESKNIVFPGMDSESYLTQDISIENE